MKPILVITSLMLSLFTYSQRITNDFFVFESILSNDSVYNSFEKKANLIKESGFNGIEIFELDQFNEKLNAILKLGFKPSSLYTKLDLDQPELDPRLVDAIKMLKGFGTIICPYIIKKNGVSLHLRDKEVDKTAIHLLRNLSDLADELGLQVAIYPHLNFYVERVDHAARIAKKANKKNLGLSFNLCHWLATTNMNERLELNKQLRTLSPYLKMISINGANNIISSKSNIWGDYILPLGEGDFDVTGLVKYVAIDLGLNIPIGIQCYNLKGNKQLVERISAQVNELKSF
jgi:sugar phosphate isomerase/epimerase